MKNYAYGVDLGGTTVKIGLFQTDGTLLQKWEIPTRTENHSVNLLPDIADAVKNNIKERNIDIADVAGIGIGVPGSIVRDSYVEQCVNLDGWGGFDVTDKLGELTGLPVKAVNDANAAALGEMSQGGGKGFKNVVFVTLGTGVGGGIIVNGDLVSGSHGAGGEIGHIKVSDPINRICGCGKSGCLEQFASATGIVANTNEMLQNTDKPSMLRKFDEITCKDVFDCAKEGDELALESVDLMQKMLGKALACIACVCDPDIFVIGGGVSRAGKIIIDGVQKYFKERTFPSCENIQFALAELGNDAGMYGAVHMILK